MRNDCEKHPGYQAATCPLCEPIERAMQMRRGDPIDNVLRFLNDICHPDQLGYAVTAEVRKRARELANELEVLNNGC